MKIGIDLDDTVVDSTPLLGEWAGRKYGRSFTKEDVLDYETIFMFPDANRSIGALYDEWYAAPGVVETLPLEVVAENAIDYLESEEHEIVFLTSRPPFAETATLAWVRRLFGARFPVHFTRENGKAGYGVDVLVDDHLRHIEAVARTGAVGIVFTQPWNRMGTPEADPNRIYRADTWGDVTKIVDLLAELAEYRGGRV